MTRASNGNTTLKQASFMINSQWGCSRSHWKSSKWPIGIGIGNLENQAVKLTFLSEVGFSLFLSFLLLLLFLFVFLFVLLFFSFFTKTLILFFTLRYARTLRRLHVNCTILGLHVTSPKIKLRNYRFFWVSTFTRYYST